MSQQAAGSCVVCGRSFTGKRVDAQTCGRACRQKLWRERRRVAPTVTAKGPIRQTNGKGARLALPAQEVVRTFNSDAERLAYLARQVAPKVQSPMIAALLDGLASEVNRLQRLVTVQGQQEKLEELQAAVEVLSGRALRAPAHRRRAPR